MTRFCEVGLPCILYPDLGKNDEDEDDYDDSPLFTRGSSARLCKHDSTRSLNDLDQQKKRKSVVGDDHPVWYVIYKTARGSIHVRESRLGSPMPENDARLPYFQAHLFATVMEDVIAQLHILDKCNNRLRHLKIMSDMNEMRSAKFGVKPSKNRNEKDCINIKPSLNEHDKLFKLIHDRRLCDAVIKETYLDLSLNQRFYQLIKHRKFVTFRKTYNLNQIEEEARNKTRQREIKKNLRHQRNRMKTSIYETNTLVNELRNRIEDSTLQREVSDRYINRWQVARSEQLTLQIQGKEAGPSGAIAKYRKKCDEEQRVHLEVETLINIQIDDTLRRIEDIMAKYDKDIEAIDFKIEMMRKNYEDQIETRLEMEQKLVDHEKEIEAWVKFKEDREKARLYRLQMTNAAIAVQAWWRGLLVRLELGPFNPKKKRPAKDKKKKK